MSAMLEKFNKEQMSKELNNIKLNTKQNYAYNLMTQGKNIFLTGPGGVGKTALIKIFHKLYSRVKTIAVTSTTGTSALLINGTTIHSYLGIGFGTGSVENLVNKIRSMSWLKKRWLSTDVLIIDEVSMMNPNLFDKIEEIARIIRKSKLPFGGIQVILSGDFCQLPVVGSDKFCFEADSWNFCIEETVYLTEIIRQGDKTFQDVLNNVRLGNINDKVKDLLKQRKDINLKNDFGIMPTKLYSTNIDVDRINDIELDKLAEKGVTFYEYEMDTHVNAKVSNKASVIDKFKKSCNAPEILQLCVGAQVMLLKNLDLSKGLANGSRGIIIGFLQDLPLVKFLNGEERIIDMEIWEVIENDKPILSAKQIPLKIAYSISIHRAQGYSLDFAEVDLSNIFEYGQAYVALSRVKSLQGLSIIGIDYDNICAHPKALDFYEKL
jgi:ATP-dependent DNA helicase PIF1